MANEIFIVQRNTPNSETGLQSVDVLVKRDLDPDLWYLWGVSGVDSTLSTNALQTFLDGELANIVQEIVDTNQVPLTGQQLDNYQNIIDLAKIDDHLAFIETNLALITTATPFTNAPTGLKDAFKDNNSAVFDALSNSAKFTLIRQAINTMLGTQADQLRLDRLLAKRAKRLGPGQGLQ